MCEQLVKLGVGTVVVKCHLGAAVRKLDLGREGIDLFGVPLCQVGVEPIALSTAEADLVLPLYKTQEHNVDQERAHPRGVVVLSTSDLLR
jgi:hypothetical protein